MDLNNAAVFHLEERIVGSTRMSDSHQSDTVQAMAGCEFDFQLTRECLRLFTSERLPRLQELDGLGGGHFPEPNINASSVQWAKGSRKLAAQTGTDSVHFPLTPFHCCYRNRK